MLKESHTYYFSYQKKKGEKYNLFSFSIRVTLGGRRFPHFKFNRKLQISTWTEKKKEKRGLIQSDYRKKQHNNFVLNMPTWGREEIWK